VDSLSYPIFLLISNFVRHEFNVVMDQAYLNFISSVVHIAVAVEVVYIINFAYSIMFGRAISASIGTPSVESLLYHLVLTSFIIGVITTDKTPLDILFAVRSLLLEGLTGSNKAGGEQVADGLLNMNLAFAASNVLTAFTHQTVSNLSTTSVNLALMSQVSPQISASVMLLINEMMVRIGMALCPLVIYAALYERTRGLFTRWLMYMVGLTIQMGALAVTTVLAARVSYGFLAALNALVLTSRASSINSNLFYISDLQQSVMQAGFGMILSALLIWFPSNAGSFGGVKLYEKTSKSSVGTFDKLRSKVYK
jgi:type IV secretion system protein VirB6